MADDPSTALLIIDMFSRFDFPGAQQLAPAAERAGPADPTPEGSL